MGRPREFDIDEAMRTATDLFWRRGYDGTSLADLTAAIGIAPPSFYVAFGNKETLFRRVVDAYQATQAAIVEDALSRKTLRAVVKRLLNGFADLLADPDHAPGCLIMNSALPIDETHPFRRLYADQRDALRTALEQRFERAAAGELGVGADAASLARLVVAMIWGFAVEAQSGASRAELRAAAASFLAHLPSPRR